MQRLAVNRALGGKGSVFSKSKHKHFRKKLHNFVKLKVKQHCLLQEAARKCQNTQLQRIGVITCFCLSFQFSSHYNSFFPYHFSGSEPCWHTELIFFPPRNSSWDTFLSGRCRSFPLLFTVGAAGQLPPAPAQPREALGGPAVTPNPHPFSYSCL